MIPRIWIGLLTVAMAWAQPSPDKPVLQIETGMHTAAISGAAMDTEERFLLTASPDKTARVWDLTTGRLLRVLRPPIGDGYEGQLYAIAMSPNGTTVACGGVTGNFHDYQFSVYLFDLKSGRLIRRIKDLPEAISHLAFSDDGHFLAGTLGGTRGVRVFRVDDNGAATVGADKVYGEATNWAEFHRYPDGSLRLATTSNDGYVRLYNVSRLGTLTLAAKSQVESGNRPYGIQFSPDGSRLAVGFSDKSMVRVLAAQNLRVLASPSVSSASGHLQVVAWSGDGRLLAGGEHQVNGGAALEVWEKMGQGTHTTWAVAERSIGQILPLRQGRVVFAAAGPAWGILDAQGNQVLEVRSSVADYHGGTLGLSASGMAVRFGLRQSLGSLASFSVIQRGWMEPSYDDSAFTYPALGGLKLTYLHSMTQFKPDEQPVYLRSGVTPTSAAVAPGADTFLQGTDTDLLCIERNGYTKWFQPAPGGAWSVNVSRDGRIAVAALGDGTIRWYRMDNGRELLAFLPHPDRKRWVLWTPSGYYDASPGGEDLIGWHVSNGRDAAADFYPASRFRSVYYRPDILSQVLFVLDEGAAVDLAKVMRGAGPREDSVARLRPPDVRILSPADDDAVTAAEVTIRYEVRNSSDEPVTGIRVLVNGRSLENARRLERVSDQQVRVVIPQQDSEVALIAENRFGAGVPATVRLHWIPPALPVAVASSKPTTVASAADVAATAPQSFVIKPKLYIFAVGIGAYPAPNRLGFPAKDARDLVAALRAQKGLLYRDVESRLLTDNMATRDAIVDGLDWIEKNTTQHDVAVVFFAGHGVNDTNGVYYFLPQNFDADKLKRTAVAESDIRNTVQALAGKIVFFVDSCHAGNAMGTRTRGLGDSDINAVANELASAENGAVVFTASTGKQQALERDDWGNGAFTKAVVEGINGAADYQKTGRITVNMLDLYVSERVKALTGGRQTPTTTKPQTIADFPVAVRR